MGYFGFIEYDYEKRTAVVAVLRMTGTQLESPDAILQIEAAYMGKATYLHGIVRYSDSRNAAGDSLKKLAEMYQKLKKDKLVEEAMRSEVPRIEPQATLKEALEK